MEVMNPCNCGGIPFVAPYYAPDDIYKDDEMFIVRCMQCGNVGMIEYTQKEAINSWNKANNLYCGVQ